MSARAIFGDYDRRLDLPPGSEDAVADLVALARRDRGLAASHWYEDDVYGPRGEDSVEVFLELVRARVLVQGRKWVGRPRSRYSRWFAAGPTSDGWCGYLDSCIGCHSSERPHLTGGFCAACAVADGAEHTRVAGVYFTEVLSSMGATQISTTTGIPVTRVRDLHLAQCRNATSDEIALMAVFSRRMTEGWRPWASPLTLLDLALAGRGSMEID